MPLGLPPSWGCTWQLNPVPLPQSSICADAATVQSARLRVMGSSARDLQPANDFAMAEPAAPLARAAQEALVSVHTYVCRTCSCLQALHSSEALGRGYFILDPKHLRSELLGLSPSWGLTWQLNLVPLPQSSIVLMLAQCSLRAWQGMPRLCVPSACK